MIAEQFLKNAPTLNFQPFRSELAQNGQKQWIRVFLRLAALIQNRLAEKQRRADALEQVLQAVELAVSMRANGDDAVDVPAYMDHNVSTKVIKIIQSYVGVINKMMWRKE